MLMLIRHFPHWFDLVALAVLALGFWSGRQRGLSGELLPLLQWITMLCVGAKFYATPGMTLAHWLKIQPNAAFVLTYGLLVVCTGVIFGGANKFMGGKIVDKEFFGIGEKYLGMLAAMIRSGCVILMGLALLSAVYVPEEEWAEAVGRRQENGGSLSLPTMGELQRQIFQKSKFGRTAKASFSGAFIKAMPPVVYPQEKIKGYGSKLQEAVDEMTEPNQTPEKNGNE